MNKAGQDVHSPAKSVDGHQLLACWHSDLRPSGAANF
ncbi:hypothetical protein GTP69_03490 [Duganella sp. CY42W]|uniref:Uncharacterized protein n=1 Tax=Duganella levis TaxID=2692169 RepID=A0ABW9VV00_9BURK|nr:hypothetical protein [Duganella levis]